MRFIVKASILISIIAAMLGSGISFFIVRWVVFAGFVYLAYRQMKHEKVTSFGEGVLVLLYLGIAFLFNPIFQVYLYSRNLWLLVDVAVLVVLFFEGRLVKSVEAAKERHLSYSYIFEQNRSAHSPTETDHISVLSTSSTSQSRTNSDQHQFDQNLSAKASENQGVRSSKTPKRSSKTLAQSYPKKQTPQKTTLDESDFSLHYADSLAGKAMDSLESTYDADKIHSGHEEPLKDVYVDNLYGEPLEDPGTTVPLGFYEYKADILFIHPYFPTRYKEHTREILDLKDLNWPVVHKFAYDLSRFLEEEDLLDDPSNTSITVVPSHDPDNKNSGVRSVAQIVCAKHGFVDATACLVRKQKVVKSTTKGADRSVEKHLGSIGVQDQYKVMGQRVIILDDVTTTGNSMKACEKLILATSAEVVQCISLAKTVHSVDDGRPVFYN